MQDIGTIENLIGEVARRRKNQKRVILGIVGSPGSGKSTVAQQIVEALGAEAQLLPMDGFHLAQSVLADLGLAHLKGAPETFDSAGFLSLLERVKSQGDDEVIYAPRFERKIEEPIACALPIRPGTSIIIVEGNYLLLDDPEWRSVRSFLDFSCFLLVENELRESRLLARHMEHGRTRPEALSWMASVDNPNAGRVEASKPNADYGLELTNQA